MNFLVTGGASGLGASIVNTLAASGTDTVYFTYSKSAAAAKEIETTHQNAHGFFCDFTDAVSLISFLEQMPGLDIDVLVNNAHGSINKEHFYKTEASRFLESYEQNVVPVLQITQEAIKTFRKKKSGKIITILSSYIINKPPTGLSAYVANKAYLLSMSKSWASEYIRFNITSNCISPSFMLTGLTNDTDERILDQMLQEHPLKKLLTTGEVANAVLYLANAPQHINGINLVMNAGVDLI